MSQLRSLPFQARLALFSLATLSLLGASGCGSSTSLNAEGIPVYPTTAKVTYRGEAVEGAHVSFSSTDSQRSAFGKTDASGVVKLTTFDYGDGAILGEHIVKISKDEVEMLDKPDPVTGNPAKIHHHVPARYGDAKASNLSATVTEGKNEFLFELTD